MPPDSVRSARLEARIAPDALSIVKRAAEIQGRSLSEFVVAAAQDAARRTIEDAGLIRLSLAGQQAFAAALLEPPARAKNLQRSFASHRRLIRDVK